MKRLWKHIPPCLSDVMGFQAVIERTDGLGIVDDPSRYKPLSTLGVGNAMPMSMGYGKPGGMRGGRDGFGGLDGRGGFGGPGGKGGRGGRGGASRVADSELRNEDIISGTEKKIIQAFEENRGIDPKFVFVCNAPSSAMISSDVESAAIVISEKGNIPAGSVKIYGEKDYLFGASMTFEAIAKLLMEKTARIENSVNILGCNMIDWSDEAVNDFTRRVEECGVTVIGRWGAEGLSAETIRRSAAASLNIVVNISGIRAARFMQEEFGIPYIVGAPYGEEQLGELISMMQEALADPAYETGTVYLDDKKTEDEPYDAIVMGEQLMANAIRRELLKKGFSNIRVFSFFEMDKKYMEPGDKKIASEDELEQLTSVDSLKLIAANPDYRGAVNKEVSWIDLPNSGMAIMTKVNPVNMTGEKLGEWLDGNL